MYRYPPYRVFISQAVTGLSRERADSELEEMKSNIRRAYFYENIEFMDFITQEYFPDKGTLERELWFYDRLLDSLEKADLTVIGLGYPYDKECNTVYKAVTSYRLNYRIYDEILDMIRRS